MATTTFLDQRIEEPVELAHPPTEAKDGETRIRDHHAVTDKDNLVDANDLPANYIYSRSQIVSVKNTISNSHNHSDSNSTVSFPLSTEPPRNGTSSHRGNDSRHSWHLCVKGLFKKHQFVGVVVVVVVGGGGGGGGGGGFVVVFVVVVLLLFVCLFC